MLQKTKKSNLKVAYYILPWCLVWFLFACSSQDPANKIDKYVAKLKKDIAVKKTKIPVKIVDLTPPKPFKFDAKLIREPFKGAEEITPKKGNAASNPLQVYPVTMLRFKGTLFENGRASAYVVTPDNKLYQVTLGDLVGDHNGRVTSIKDEQIEVTEPDSSGKATLQNVVVLKLKDDNK